MNCTYHPNKDATTQCSQCQKPLCDECALSGKERDFVCSRCEMLLAAQDAFQGIYQQREEIERKRQVMEAKAKRKSRAFMIVVISFAVVVLIANLYFYLSTPGIPSDIEYDPYDDLELTAAIIDDAIMDYAIDHGGKFPEKLDDTLGKYMPSEKITSSILEKFSYIRSSPHSYELRLKDSGDGTVSSFVFTEED